MLKILALADDNGPGIHRIIMPYMNMPDVDVYLTNAPKESDFEGVDVLVYNRVVKQWITDKARSLGIKIVCDVDDYWFLDSDHILYEHYLNTRFAELQADHMVNADIVTVSNAKLAEAVYPFNKNVHVLPNAISPKWKVERTQSKYTRIFWQGSDTHEHDIRLVAGAMRKLNKNKYAAIVAGYTGSPVFDRIVNYMTNNLQLPGTIIPATKASKYYEAYAHADICLAPLRETRFNSFKSNLKILEAARLGLPVIASSVSTYEGMEGVIYASKGANWYDAIMGNASDLSTSAKLLHEYCNKYHNFDLINEQRKSIIS